MSTLRQIALGLGLIASIVGLIYFQQVRLESAQEEKVAAQNRAATAEQSIQGHKATINELTSALATERTSQQQLQAQQSEIRQQLRTRQQQIEALTRENEELRQWATTELPATARSLRDRPAITGAADYQAWLSRRNALHPLGNATPEQRQPAD
tara:strand:- start:332 stop:793 length:462 start_codon:yes stop_codon:yes gene_type:complete